jgi:hypothetical protein
MKDLGADHREEEADTETEAADTGNRAEEVQGDKEGIPNMIEETVSVTRNSDDAETDKGRMDQISQEAVREIRIRARNVGDYTVQEKIVPRSISLVITADEWDTGNRCAGAPAADAEGSIEEAFLSWKLQGTAGQRQISYKSVPQDTCQAFLESNCKTNMLTF